MAARVDRRGLRIAVAVGPDLRARVGSAHEGVVGRHVVAFRVVVAHRDVEADDLGALPGEEPGGGRADAGMPQTHGRIELADLKERVRKLEAIANGIDL